MANSIEGENPSQHNLIYGDESVLYDVVTNDELIDKIRIHVRSDGSVQIEKPCDIDADKFHNAVAKRARWIVKHRDEIAIRKKHATPKEYVSGETFFYLGRRHQLKVIETSGEPSRVRLFRGKIEVFLPVADHTAVKRRLSSWYRSRALAYFQQRLASICKDVPWIDKIPEIRLLKMQKQWGNCSKSGLLTLNPALIRAPRECVDYVIKHELCHIAEHNHSPRFYRHLERLVPQWAEQEMLIDNLTELLLAE